MKYAEWYQQRRREAKAKEEAANPSLASRRDSARRKYHRRKERVAEQSAMQAAFLQALRLRVGSTVQPSNYLMLPVGQVLVRELAQVLQAMDRATKSETC